MISKKDYLYAKFIVNIYEEYLGIYDNEGSIPFSEFYDFNNWMEDQGWFAVSDDQYDNEFEPNSAVRLTIKELYLSYKLNHKNI